jgi:translation initiation factor 2 subunit 3
MIFSSQRVVFSEISPVFFIRFSDMTIKLGYANVKIYECDSPDCPRPERFEAAPSDTRGTFHCARFGCDGTMHLVRHISIVDCPGHEVLMQTMLNGAAVMDSAMLVVAADRPCPEPQTLYVPLYCFQDRYWFAISKLAFFTF